MRACSARVYWNCSWVSKADGGGDLVVVGVVEIVDGFPNEGGDHVVVEVVGIVNEFSDKERKETLWLLELLRVVHVVLDEQGK